MADFNTAVTKTLGFEGGFVQHEPPPKGTGEVVNMGITLSLLRSEGILPQREGPATDGEVAYVKVLTVDAVKALYETYFWKPILGDQLNDQDVANKVFDLGVNCGVVMSVKFAQHAANLITWPSPQLVEDCRMGPATLASINGCGALLLLSGIRAQAETYYRNIAAANPLLAPNLDSWLRRLAA